MQTRLFGMIKHRDLFHFLKIFLSVVAMVVLTGEVSLAAQPGKKASSSACRLNSEKGNIEHVIFLIFDNCISCATTRTCHRISSRCRICSTLFEATARC